MELPQCQSGSDDKLQRVCVTDTLCTPEQAPAPRQLGGPSTVAPAQWARGGGKEHIPSLAFAKNRRPGGFLSGHGSRDGRTLAGQDWGPGRISPVLATTAARVHSLGGKESLICDVWLREMSFGQPGGAP